jgi:hypothetical protein
MKGMDSGVFAYVRGQRKISQVPGAFVLLDFTMLRPVLDLRGFLTLRSVHFFNFPFLTGRGKPRILNQWIWGTTVYGRNQRRVLTPSCSQYIREGSNIRTLYSDCLNYYLFYTNLVARLRLWVLYFPWEVYQPTRKTPTLCQSYASVGLVM